MAATNFFSLDLRRAASATTAGITLSIATVAALWWSGLSPVTYRSVVASTSPFILTGLMTFFFLVIGLDLGHELSDGFLRDARQSLPALSAAVGGMFATAGCALLIGHLGELPALERGWGVPMATDIAFALAALSLSGAIGRHLRHFVLVLAVADDIGSVLVLAFSGHHLLRGWWVAAAIGGGMTVVLVRRHVPLVAWVAVLVALWVCFFRAGIDAPLSAVLVGMCIPAAQRVSAARAFRILTAGVNLVVLPLFALVATGVIWTSLSRSPQGVAVAMGLAIARIAGKVIGIAAGAIVASRVTGVSRPSLAQLLPVGLVCAMGVTVPRIFAHQVYGDSSTYAVTTATLLGVTVLSGATGVVLLRRLNR